MENRPVSIESILSKIEDVDIIITEGYKHGIWPKIAIRRSETGKSFPIDINQCVALVSDKPENAGIPCFGLDDTKGLADFICRGIGETGTETVPG